MKIAFIGMGEAGTVFSTGLAVGGAEVAGYDLLMEKPEEMWRFDAVKNAGVKLTANAGEAAEGAAIVIAATQEHLTVQTAESVKEHLKPGQIYLELNSSDPIVKGKIRDLLAGIDVVDGAIMHASVAAKKHRTSVYVSGARGQEVADKLNKYGMNVTFVDKTFGAASGIKIIRGIIMKGIEALAMESVHAASCLGIQDSFLAEIYKTFRETNFENKLYEMITTNPNHAYRHGEETISSLKLLDELGIDTTMSRAIAAKYFYNASLGLDKKFNGVTPKTIEEVLDALPKPKHDIN